MDSLRKYTFKKEEKLCNIKMLEALFSGGNSFFSYPFRVLYTENSKTDDFPVKVVFTVPKKNIKLAVTRNLIKRRMREAYRLNKHLLYESAERNGQRIVLAFIFTAKEPIDYKQIEKGIVRAIKKISSLI